MEFPVFPELPIEQPENSISYHFEDADIDLPDEERLTAWLLAVAVAEGKPVHEVAYIFCSDDYLLQMNRDYLQHDYYTDVITFPYSQILVHGDIFISTDRIRDNARTNNISLERELCRVMVHGVLHLAGYSDKTDIERAQMTEKENFYLKKFVAT